MELLIKELLKRKQFISSICGACFLQTTNLDLADCESVFLQAQRPTAQLSIEYLYGKIQFRI